MRWKRLENEEAQKLIGKLFIKHKADKVSIEHIYPQTPTKKYWMTMFKGTSNEQKTFFQGTTSYSQSIDLSLQKWMVLKIRKKPN